MSEKQPTSEFAEGLLEGLREAVAWKRGRLALETVNLDPMPAERVRAIRRKVAKSAREFERRFGIPAATMSNWEQGRRQPDPAARLLLLVLEREPDAVERAIAQEAPRTAAE
jgi:putative transcriptional regulator